MNLVIITKYRVCNSDTGGIRTVVLQLNRFNNVERKEKYYRRKYIEDLEKVIKEFQEQQNEILLSHDIN